MREYFKVYNKETDKYDIYYASKATQLSGFFPHTGNIRWQVGDSTATLNGYIVGVSAEVVGKVGFVVTDSLKNENEYSMPTLHNRELWLADNEGKTAVGDVKNDMTFSYTIPKNKLKNDRYYFVRAVFMTENEENGVRDTTCLYAPEVKILHPLDTVDFTQLAGTDNDLAMALDMFHSIPIGKIIIIFLVFFLFGYLLYASLFAAIGSAVENAEDTQQLQIPLTVPLMLGYIIALYAFKAPDSSIAFWASLFPFTSPIVMIARLPFGVPGWEIALSLGLLILTFIVCAWASAKIYKVGILMFGKKSSWKDLWKWLKQS